MRIRRVAVAVALALGLAGGAAGLTMGGTVSHASAPYTYYHE